MRQRPRLIIQLVQVIRAVPEALEVLEVEDGVAAEAKVEAGAVVDLVEKADKALNDPVLERATVRATLVLMPTLLLALSNPPLFRSFLHLSPCSLYRIKRLRVLLRSHTSQLFTKPAYR
jgi:hypothetical protein